MTFNNISFFFALKGSTIKVEQLTQEEHHPHQQQPADTKALAERQKKILSDIDQMNSQIEKITQLTNGQRKNHENENDEKKQQNIPTHPKAKEKKKGKDQKVDKDSSSDKIESTTDKRIAKPQFEPSNFNSINYYLTLCKHK